MTNIRSLFSDDQIDTILAEYVARLVRVQVQAEVKPKGVGGKRRYTDEQEKQIADEYDSGASMRDLLDKWGMAPATLYTIVRRQGRRVDRQRTSILTSKSRAIREDHEAGMSVAAIMQKHNVSHSSIYRCLKRLRTAS